MPLATQLNNLPLHKLQCFGLVMLGMSLLDPSLCKQSTATGALPNFVCWNNTAKAD